MPVAIAGRTTRPMRSLTGPDSEDRDLVARLRSGDGEAFRDLFDRHAPIAKALALRIVRQLHLAEEIVQDVFLAVWRKPDSYDAVRGSVRSWIMAMVHHRAVDVVRREESLRRRADHAAVDVRGDVATDHADDVVEAIGRPEERSVVRAALAELPAAQREVIELMYFDGLTQRQVAERTGVPLGTVKSRTLLGMRRMRSSLARWER